ncbi:MAG: hypothetical protein ACJ8ER_05305 [Allosphingosinicella sp.]
MQYDILIAAAAWATVIANVAAAIFIGLQVWKMNEGNKQGRMQNQHTLCLEIWKNYNDVFSDRQWLMENPVTIDALHGKYESIDAIFNSDEYKKLRRVATVYGMAASLIKTGAIDGSVVFNYISVPRKLWDDHWPLVKHIRENYYEHLFVGWELLTFSEYNPWQLRRRQGIEAPVKTQVAAPEPDGPAATTTLNDNTVR